jgi:hypothetical protein
MTTKLDRLEELRKQAAAAQDAAAAAGKHHYFAASDNSLRGGLCKRCGKTLMLGKHH